MAAYENILVDRKDAVGVIRLNRPKALNALCTPLVEELGRALDDFEADDAIGCVVITGSEKARRQQQDEEDAGSRQHRPIYAQRCRFGQ